MYKDIEEIYKKKSPYNRIKKRTFLVYVIFMLIALFFNYLNEMALMFSVFAVMFVVMFAIVKHVSEEVLNTKLHFGLIKPKDYELTLPAIIKEKEKELFKEHSVKNSLYNEKALLCIINHYRNMIKTKIVGENLLAILSVAMPILLAFYTKDGFDFHGLANTLPYLIGFTIMIILLYFLYNEIIEVKKFIKGEDGMIGRLEEIYSEIYMDWISEFNANEKEKSKKQNKKNHRSKKMTIA